jgi:hypothetical protein
MTDEVNVAATNAVLGLQRHINIHRCVLYAV